MPAGGFAFQSPADALAALLDHVKAVDTERVRLADASGRVLAEEIRTDRPSPACDVSAMDGFAVRVAEVHASGGMLPIKGEGWIGQERVLLAPASAVRIVTGAPLPGGADAVIKREDVLERGDRIEISAEAVRTLRAGEALRRQGENAPAGRVVLEPGAPIGAHHVAALASVGAASPLVYRRVRVAILVTGDELLPVEATPAAWELRDSNGPALGAMFGRLMFAQVRAGVHAADDLAATREALRDAAASADVVLVTGGVSMGDRDFVPRALADIGARTLFHKLPQRPGKPVLAALLPDGKPVLALPGNPVSVLVTARRLGVPTVRKVAGFRDPVDPPRLITIDRADDKVIDLWWHRPVRLTGASGGGGGELVANMGSGDVMGVAGSDGFVEVPPGECGPGPWPYFAWSS